MSAKRHPIAALLTPEMRERIRAATFTNRRHPDWAASVIARIDGKPCCPMGVALGVGGFPGSDEVAEALPVGYERGQRIAQSFIDLVDNGDVSAADVKAMLGADEGGKP